MLGLIVGNVQRFQERVDGSRKIVVIRFFLFQAPVRKPGFAAGQECETAAFVAAVLVR